jgi:hypothetical protein
MGYVCTLGLDWMLRIMVFDERRTVVSRTGSDSICWVVYISLGLLVLRLEPACCV